MSMNLLKPFALLLIVLAQFEYGFGQQTLCGPTLDMLLSTVCENGFNTRFKKSMQWSGQDNGVMDDEMTLPYASFPFLLKIHGGQVDTVAKSRRRRQGVYDECCRKPCKMSELYSYCK